MPRTLCVQPATLIQVQEMELRVHAALQAQAVQQLALRSIQILRTLHVAPTSRILNIRCMSLGAKPSSALPFIIQFLNLF